MGLVVCLLLFNCIWLVYDGVVLVLYGLLLMLVIVLSDGCKVVMLWFCLAVCFVSLCFVPFCYWRVGWWLCLWLLRFVLWWLFVLLVAWFLGFR